MSRFDDRLLAMERLLQELSEHHHDNAHGTNSTARQDSNRQEMTPSSIPISRTRQNYQEGPVHTFGTSSNVDSTKTVETTFPRDTVDGMGAITFADECASGHFGWRSITRPIHHHANALQGPTSNSAFFRHIAKALSDGHTSGLQQARSVTTNQVSVDHISRPPSPFTYRPESSYANGGHKGSNQVFTLPPQPEIVRLVDLFFGNTGILFPYIYKKRVFDNIATMNLTEPSEVRQSWLCLLNTIMAFATCITKIPNRRTMTDSTSASVFLQRALELLPNLMARPANLETRRSPTTPVIKYE
jgi:hypothetical protein